jgi:ankyrin repeat protein
MQRTKVVWDNCHADVLHLLVSHGVDLNCSINNLGDRALHLTLSMIFILPG